MIEFVATPLAGARSAWQLSEAGLGFIISSMLLRKPLALMLKILIAIVIILTSHSSEAMKAVKGSPNFFPVEFNRFSNEQMVILPFECRRGEKISWLQEYENSLQGLKPTSEIRAYNLQGKSVDGVLGSPACFPGECRADYVAIPLSFDNKLNGEQGVGVKDIVLVSGHQNLSVKAITIVEKECANVTEGHKNPHGFDFEALPTMCSDVLSSGGLLGQMISFGWLQQNGWKVFHQFFRPMPKQPNKKQGGLTEIGYSTSKQLPVFEFQSEENKTILLWFEKSGIGAVSYFKLRESTFNYGGDLVWKSAYQAGGQPCD